MLKAVSNSEFLKWGCVNCGCAFVHGSFSGGGTYPVQCGKCETNFVILADGLTKSAIGFGNMHDDETHYPELEDHPRRGIPKHKFVRPDVRPENGIGEFCEPRGVGYDLACFVKSKEAGERIVRMFRVINARVNTGFICRLDYREKEPLWIQVKIAYKDQNKAEKLDELIRENGNIITLDIIMQAALSLETIDKIKRKINKNHKRK